MQHQKYAELENRAVDSFPEAIAEEVDAIRKLEARAIVHREIEKMRDAGEALTLSEEEMAMLAEFRRFKLRMRRQGEVFKWQSRIQEGVEIVSDTALISHPREAENAI